MLTFVVPAADILPNILASLGLPPAVYNETADEQTGETKCSASLHCSSSSSGPDGLRVFTASSPVDAGATAKHLAAILAIQHLKGLYNFSVVDVNHKELADLKSTASSSSEMGCLRNELTRTKRDKPRAQAAGLHFKLKAIHNQRSKAQLIRISEEFVRDIEQLEAETQLSDDSDDSGTVSPDNEMRMRPIAPKDSCQ